MQTSAVALSRPGRSLWPGPWAAPRIAVGGIAHETNTLSPVPTTLDDFLGRSYLSGEDLVHPNRGTRNVLGGAIADDRAALLPPTLFASPMPSGGVEPTAWDVLRTRLLDRLRARQRGPRSPDGVLLVRHGAMVAAVDPALFRLVGIEPTACRIAAVTSSVHFRAAFAPLAAAIGEVEMPGLSSSDPSTFPSRHVRRPIAPLDPLVRSLD